MNNKQAAFKHGVEIFITHYCHGNRDMYTQLMARDHGNDQGDGYQIAVRAFFKKSGWGTADEKSTLLQGGIPDFSRVIYSQLEHTYFGMDLISYR